MMQPGDEVYFHVGGQPAVGKVLCHGKHGATVESGGKRYKVRHEHVLGRKAVTDSRAKVVDQGLDGAIVEDEGGRRRYVHGLTDDAQASEQDGAEQGQTPLGRIAKALGEGVVLFTKATGEVKNRPGLHLERVTDRQGHAIQRWKKTAQDQAGHKKAGRDPDDVRGARHGYGTHDIRQGDHVSFDAGGVRGHGRVVAVGKDGATVADQAGKEHPVRWHEILGHKAASGTGGSGGRKPPEVVAGEGEAQEDKPKSADRGTVLGSQAPLSPDKFVAADYARSHDQPEVTEASILDEFPADTRQRIADAQDRLASIEQTIGTYRQADGSYRPDRVALHERIFFDGVHVKDPATGEELFVPPIFSPEKVQAARPADGQLPVFILLGGRGGSGKSSLDGMVYDAARCIVLDSDAIKSMIPEYEGWNADQVHEESSDLFDRAVMLARDLGLNVVLDKTMKTAKSAVDSVKAFKAAGYRCEAHYMHLPRQEAARRAVSRFVGGGRTGRYVPPAVVLANTSNEASFDQVRQHVDAWTFHDNNVPRGQKPILISQLGEPALSKGEVLKSHGSAMILLWSSP